MPDRVAKQLILLLDGTWNDADVGPCDTNIVRLRELINRSLTAEPMPSDSRSFATDRKFQPDEKHRLIFYERGVGTGPLLDRFYGGALGKGLESNVRRAYKFLSWYYEPGDEIFIFGFSRGAYTARSLVGVLGSAGLLKRTSCDEGNEHKVWDYYRTATNDRVPGRFDELTAYVHDRESFEIACIGVFDTVGALGVPLPVFFRLNREAHGFHDVDLGSITACNLHALAIDEHREPFQATVWRKPKFKTFKADMLVEQVWFAGAHGDVGGGYTTEWDRPTLVHGTWQHRRSLDDITLDWMLKRVLYRFPDFPVRLEDREVDGIVYPRVWAPIDESWSDAPHHDPRKGLYLARPHVVRAINNYAGRGRSWPRHPPYLAPDKFVGYDRHSEPLGEAIHVSALLRYGRAVGLEGKKVVYRPENLRRVLPYVAATYGLVDRIVLERPILVVDWSGNRLDPAASGAREVIARLFAVGNVIRSDLDERVKEVLLHTPRIES